MSEYNLYRVSFELDGIVFTSQVMTSKRAVDLLIHRIHTDRTPTYVGYTTFSPGRFKEEDA